MKYVNAKAVLPITWWRNCEGIHTGPDISISQPGEVRHRAWEFENKAAAAGAGRRNAGIVDAYHQGVLSLEGAKGIITVFLSTPIRKNCISRVNHGEPPVRRLPTFSGCGGVISG